MRSSGSDGAGQRSVGPPAGDAAVPLDVGGATDPTLPPHDAAKSTAHATAIVRDRVGGLRMTVPSELVLRPGAHYAVRKAGVAKGRRGQGLD